MSFNFSEEMSVASMDVSLNGKKIAKLESGSPKAIINWPYRLVYINKKLLNKSENIMKFQLTGFSGKCIKDKVLYMKPDKISTMISSVIMYYYYILNIYQFSNTINLV